MTKLEFGRPQTPRQAFYRLPTKDHPHYDDNEAIEHLAHISSALFELQILGLKDLGQLQQTDLDERLFLLTLEELQIMEEVSFRRAGNIIALAQHEFIQKGNLWSSYLPSGDDGYRWWKVTDIEPDLGIAGARFVCIESNKRYEHMHDTQWRSRWRFRI